MTDWVPTLASHSRAALSRLRVRAGGRHRVRPRQARHAAVAPARHGAAARPQRRHDLKSLCGGRAARTDLGRSRPRHLRATAAARGARSRRIGSNDQSGAECAALYRRRRRHRIRALGDRRRRRDVEPARLSAASGPAPASRGDGDLAHLARHHRRCRPSLHHPWRAARAVDRARHGRSTRRYRADRKLHLFRHARALGAVTAIGCTASPPTRTG